MFDFRASGAAGDPIFGAIDAHREASAAVLAAVELHDILEAELPVDERRSTISVFGEQLVETDDWRWVECERAVLLAWKKQDEAALALLSTRPATLAGVRALLRYAVEADADGQGWPPAELTGGRPWQHFLIENAAAALSQCA
jgi:hypothetical protein